MRPGQRILAFAAHPDDLEYFVGGTLALCAEFGAEVRAVVATDGERGGTRRGLGGLRRSEQCHAGRILGYASIWFLSLPDGELALVRPRLDAGVLAALRRHRPDTVLTFDALWPRRFYIHPDHQAVGRSVLDACRKADPQPALYLFHTRSSNVVVDVGTVWRKKIAALRAYRSQGSGEQLPRAIRPLWRAFSGRSGFPIPPRKERLRRLDPADPP